MSTPSPAQLTLSPNAPASSATSHTRITAAVTILTFDADKVRSAIRAHQLRELEFIDGAPNVVNLRKAVELNQLPPSTLSTPHAMKAALDVSSRPSLWAPAHALARVGVMPDTIIDVGSHVLTLHTAGSVQRLLGRTSARHHRLGVGGHPVHAAHWQALDPGLPVSFLVPSPEKFGVVMTATFPVRHGNLTWKRWGISGKIVSGTTTTTPLSQVVDTDEPYPVKTRDELWALVVRLTPPARR